MKAGNMELNMPTSRILLYYNQDILIQSKMEDKQIAKPGHYEQLESIGDQLFQGGSILQAIQFYKRIIEEGYKVDFQIQGLGFFDHCDRRYEWFAYKWYDEQRKNGKIRGNVFDVLSLCFGLVKNKQEMTIQKGILWYQDMLAKREDFQLYVGYANILNNKGRYEEAIKVYNKILKIKPLFVNAYVATAMIYEFNRVQKPKAIEMASKAIELDTNNMYALFILGKNETNIEKKITKLIQNHNKWPEYVRNTNEVGLAFGAKKDSKQAIVWYKKCLQIAPQNAQTYNNIGYRLSVLQQYKQALSWYFKSCEWDPKYKQALQNAIDTFKALGLSANNIIEEMGKYPKLDHFYFYYYLGLAYFDKKQVNTAIQWYKRAQALDDQNYALYNSIGLAYQNGKDYANGEKYYQKSIRLSPKYHYPYYNLGLLQRHRGNTQKAIEWYKKAIQINPRYHPSYNNLGNIYKDRGEYDKAIDYYRECVEIHSTYTLVYANMGICLLNLQRYQEAFNTFARSKQLLPTDNNGLNQSNKTFLKEHLDKFDKEGEKWSKTSSISHDQKQNLRYLIRSYQSNFKQELSNMNAAPFSDEIVLRPQMLEALNLIMADKFELRNIKDTFRCIKKLFRKDEQYLQIIPQLFIQFFLKRNYSQGQSIKSIEAHLQDMMKSLRIDAINEFLEKGIRYQEINTILLKLGYPSTCSVDLFKQTSFFDSYEALYAQIERINKLATGSLRDFTELVQSIRVRSNGKSNKVTVALPKRTQLQFPTMIKIIKTILRDEINEQWKQKLLQKIAKTLKKQEKPTQIGIIHEVIDIWINEVTIILKQRFKDQIETKCNINDLLRGKVQFEKIQDIILALQACVNQCCLHGYEILSIQNLLPSHQLGIKINIRIGQAVCQLHLDIFQDDTGSRLIDSISELQNSPLGFIFGSYLFMSKGFNYPLLLNCKHIAERLKSSPSAEDQKTLQAARYLIGALEANNKK